MDTLDYTPVNATQIRQWTARDPLVSQVREMVLQGWEVDTEELRPYRRKKDELSVQDGCLLWGKRVVVPLAGRSAVLDESHPGVARMKSLGRSYVWCRASIKTSKRKCENAWNASSTRKSPTPPVGLARSTMVQAPHRSRWPLSGKNVPCRGELALKMARRHANIPDYDPEASIHLRHAWVAGDVGFQQRDGLHQHGISGIREAKRDSPCHERTLPLRL